MDDAPTCSRCGSTTDVSIFTGCATCGPVELCAACQSEHVVAVAGEDAPPYGNEPIVRTP